MILRAPEGEGTARVVRRRPMGSVLFVRDLTNTRWAAFDLPDRVGVRPFSSAVPGDRLETNSGGSDPHRLQRRVRSVPCDLSSWPLVTANREDYGGGWRPV